MENEYTYATPGVCQCNDCGAYADTKENIVHHDTCKPGESRKWAGFYAEEEE